MPEVLREDDTNLETLLMRNKEPRIMASTWTLLITGRDMGCHSRKGSERQKMGQNDLTVV